MWLGWFGYGGLAEVDGWGDSAVVVGLRCLGWGGSTGVVDLTGSAGLIPFSS